MEWEKFKRTYAREGIVLVLGAGVSLCSGIPRWENLIRGMVTDSFGGDAEIFDQLRAKMMSFTAMASLLEERTLAGRKAFVEQVRKALYGTFPFYPDGVDEGNYTQLVNYIEKGTDGIHVGIPNHTLHSVGAFCTVWKDPVKGESGYNINPKVHAVVTLNMDALLQSYINAMTKRRLLRTVERPSVRLYPDRINIYHIHGYLHFDTRNEDPSRDKPINGKQARDAPEAVVLTEQDYYNFYNNPNSLFNYTFLYLLREYSCLFIGLSMEDENIRRLLHYSKMERMHSLEKQKGRPVESITDPQERARYIEKLREECSRHVAILERSGNSEVDQAQEATLHPLGVSVLRVKPDFSDLPKKLGSLYKAADRDGWAKVFK
jgi:hypothetical protein